MKTILLNLEKVLEKGTLRYIGAEYNSKLPYEMVIAGNTIRGISEASNLQCYQIGRYDPHNGFIITDYKSLFYAYVNPHYKNYGKLFRELVCDFPKDYHVDHVLARNLAKILNYKYVLLCAVPSKVNSRHGHYEKITIDAELISSVPDVCYADIRIFDKIMARNPLARRKFEKIKLGYNPANNADLGLTLKQKGQWNSAFCFDRIISEDVLVKLKAI